MEAEGVPSVQSMEMGNREMFRTAFAGAFATALVGMGAGFAQASPVATVPDASYYNIVSFTEPNGLQHFDSTHLPTTGLHVQGANTSDIQNEFWNGTTDNNYGVPFVNTAIRVGNGVTGASESQLTYYVEFTGNTPTVDIGVKGSGNATYGEIDGTGHAGNPGENQAVALMYMIVANDPFLTQVFREVASSDSSNPGTHLFSLDQQFTVHTNVVYEVFMDAYTSAEDKHFAAAGLDPYFTVPTGYSILTSSGIGNAPPATTPIPAALPLFTTGLGALGLLGRRRKKAARAA